MENSKDARAMGGVTTGRSERSSAGGILDSWSAICDADRRVLLEVICERNSKNHLATTLRPAVVDGSNIRPVDHAEDLARTAETIASSPPTRLGQRP